MKEFLKMMAREVIVPWALAGLAAIAGKKLAPKAPKVDAAD